MAFETSGAGIMFLGRNSKDMVGQKNSGLFKANGSIEDLKDGGLKGHKRSNQEQRNIHMTMTNELGKWDEAGSASPENRNMYAKDKLKTLTTHLGTGASRNSASKGILTGGNASKGSKKGKYKSPKYMTQNNGSYYLKGKNSSVLSRWV